MPPSAKQLFKEYLDRNGLVYYEGPHLVVIEDRLYWPAELSEIPRGLEVLGSLAFLGKISRLPENLRVGDILDISGQDGLTELPSGLVVGSDLDATGCTELSGIPSDLHVKGSLYLRNTKVGEFPSGVRVGMSLNFFGCTQLYKLPDGLHVPGKLTIEDCRSLKALPRGLAIGGSLKLAGECRITNIPYECEALGGLVLGDDMSGPMSAGKALFNRTAMEFRKDPEAATEALLDVQSLSWMRELARAVLEAG